VFRARLRRAAFGWRGSKLAIVRIDEALAEIRAVARHDPAAALDFGAFYARYAGGGARNQPFHPAMMVKLLVYGYATGVFSSRKIERRAVLAANGGYTAANLRCRGVAVGRGRILDESISPP